MKLSKGVVKSPGLLTAVVLILLTVLAFTGFYYNWKNTATPHYQPQSNPLETSPTPGQESSPVSMNVEDWKQYKDPSRKFMINFPQNWIISFTPSQRYKDKTDISLKGPDGHIDIFWSDSYGGACADPGYEKIQIKSGEETVCHMLDNNGVPEYWQLQKQFVKNKPEGIYLNAYANIKASEVLPKIIQSLNIAK